MRGTRRLLGSYNLGSMANAMPQALGAAGRSTAAAQVVAFCGDGGLTMLLGDLLTAVAYDLPVKLVVFDNGRLGMVKLEQEQGGLPEFGTVLHNPDFAAVARAMGLHGIRVDDPDDVDGRRREAFAHPGPVLLDVVTNPEEISLPPKVNARPGLGLRDRQGQGDTGQPRRRRLIHAGNGAGVFAIRAASHPEANRVFHRQGDEWTGSTSCSRRTRHRDHRPEPTSPDPGLRPTSPSQHPKKRDLQWTRTN